MFMRVLLKNEARLYAPAVSAIEMKDAGRPPDVSRCLYSDQHEQCCESAPNHVPAVIMSGGSEMPAWLTTLFDVLALPQYGLTTLFLAAFVSATLLPVGSEPALYGLLRLNPELFWSAMLVATAGNTLGGALDWWMGYEAHAVVDKYRHSRTHAKALDWLERLGPKACLLSWLPIVGDPLCAVAGWLKLPFWPCVGYMVIGKFLRYLVMTIFLQHTFGT
jgi:membrane protein YqaA with SNARE-associated domain